MKVVKGVQLAHAGDAGDFDMYALVLEDGELGETIEIQLKQRRDGALLPELIGKVVEAVVMSDGVHEFDEQGQISDSAMWIPQVDLIKGDLGEALAMRVHVNEHPYDVIWVGGQQVGVDVVMNTTEPMAAFDDLAAESTKAVEIALGMVTMYGGKLVKDETN